MCSCGVGGGNSENQGCFKASAALIRAFGSIVNMFDRRSKPLIVSVVKFGVKCEMLVTLLLFLFLVSCGQS